MFPGGIFVYKLCKTEQSAARQRKLELGLLEVMESHPYEQISVSELCQWLGVPRKSFYRYFSGKDGALHALIDHTLTEYAGGNHYWLLVNQNSVHKELETLFDFWKGQKQLLDVLQRNGLSGVLTERAVYHALELTGMNLQAANRSLATEQEHATVFLSCGLMSLIVQWHYGGYVLTSRQMADISCRILSRPLIEE